MYVRWIPRSSPVGTKAFRRIFIVPGCGRCQLRPDLAYYLDCDLCPIIRKIAAIEPIGWLVAPPRPPRKPKSPQQKLRESIKQADAAARRAQEEANRLRMELSQLPKASHE